MDARRLADPELVLRVLAIKVHDQLGDFLLTTPALRALRRRFPRARLALATRDFLAPLARRHPDLDLVWALPRVDGPKHLAALIGILGRIAAFRPDLVVVLNSVSRSKTSDALAALSRAGLVVGRSRVGAGAIPEGGPAARLASEDENARDPVYDLDVPFAPNSDQQVDRYLDLVRWCGADGPAELVLVLSDDERREGTRAIVAAFGGANPARPLVGLHPGAANPLKCWPLESFVELGAALGNVGLVVFDSPREHGRAAAVCAGLEARGIRPAFLPAAGIEDFAARSAALDLLVCNDSGVLHVASALGVATVSFHALGRLSEWAPRSDRAVALSAPQDIAGIPVAAAVEAARALLKVVGATMAAAATPADENSQRASGV